VFYTDIAGQASEPASAKAAPKQKAEDNDHASEDDEKFSELGHAVNLVNYVIMSSTSRHLVPCLNYFHKIPRSAPEWRFRSG
jgi:hypothetical protein